MSTTKRTKSPRPITSEDLSRDLARALAPLVASLRLAVETSEALDTLGPLSAEGRAHAEGRTAGLRIALAAIETAIKYPAK